MTFLQVSIEPAAHKVTHFTDHFVYHNNGLITSCINKPVKHSALRVCFGVYPLHFSAWLPVVRTGTPFFYFLKVNDRILY